MTWRADWASLSFMHLSFLSPPLPLSLPPILSPCADGSHPPSLPALAPLVPRPATSSPLCSAFALAAAALRLRTRRRAPPPHSPWHPAPILAAAPGLRARRGAPPPSSPPRPTSALAAAPLHHPCRGAPPPSLPRHPPWCAAARGFRRRQGQRERRRGGGGRRACPVGLEGAWTRPRSSVPAGPTRGQGGGGRRPAPHRSPTRWPPASTRERACGGAGRARPSSQSRAVPVPLPRAPPPRVETGLPGPHRAPRAAELRRGAMARLELPSALLSPVHGGSGHGVCPRGSMARRRPPRAGAPSRSGSLGAAASLLAHLLPTWAARGGMAAPASSAGQGLPRRWRRRGAEAPPLRGARRPSGAAGPPSLPRAEVPPRHGVRLPSGAAELAGRGEPLGTHVWRKKKEWRLVSVPHQR